MADLNQPANKENWLEEPKKLPSMLNVLTILTLIWNPISILLSIYAFFTAQSNYDKMVQVQDKIDQMPDFFKSMMGSDPVGAARKALDNRVPVLLLGLAGAILCLFGAIQMRKLKKTGFSIYVIGDIVPFVSMIFVGTGAISGVSAILGIGLTVLFLILYGTQLKYMK
jgi:hypothetical protein